MPQGNPQQLPHKGYSTRATAYKKAQDLYNTDRNSLANIICSGKPIPQHEIFPNIREVDKFYRGILESDSPDDLEPFDALLNVDTTYCPITECEVESVQRSGSAFSRLNDSRIGQSSSTRMVTGVTRATGDRLLSDRPPKDSFNSLTPRCTPPTSTFERRQGKNTMWRPQGIRNGVPPLRVKCTSTDYPVDRAQRRVSTRIFRRRASIVNDAGDGILNVIFTDR